MNNMDQSEAMTNRFPIAVSRAEVQAWVKSTWRIVIGKRNTPQQLYTTVQSALADMVKETSQ